MLKLRFQQNSYLYLVPGYSTFLNAAEGLDTRVVCETADGRLEAVGDYALLRGRAPRLEKVFQKSEEQLASDEVLKRNGQKQKGQAELDNFGHLDGRESQRRINTFEDFLNLCSITSNDA